MTKESLYKKETYIFTILKKDNEKDKNFKAVSTYVYSIPNCLGRLCAHLFTFACTAVREKKTYLG